MEVRKDTEHDDEIRINTAEIPDCMIERLCAATRQLVLNVKRGGKQ